MAAYIIDVVIILILVFFAWRGGKKGLILTLFGLAGLFVAFFGARLVSNTFYEPVADMIRPGIYQSIHDAVPGSTAADPDVVDPSAQPGGDADPDAQPEEDTPSLGDLLDALKDSGLFQGFMDLLDGAAESGDVPSTPTQTPAQALAAYLSTLIARAALFAIGFLVILLAWTLLSRALNLAFHLPVLSAVNTVGGVVLGLMKAALIVIVLVWLGQLAGWIPAQPTTPVASLFTTRRLLELLNLLLV